ncbi:hypothetical protein HPB52_014993 [Rhipicephalus sanguineus]|uniref:Glutaredoxin domain-containing protein n=1 Tax=Rhipicephalus sanguineus TaxID=34632 RepID=A0A9D4TAI0_RHISA|nr:hypothetical protein HPB52_014993 [Rhipicephalus sanguineus]
MRAGRLSVDAEQAKDVSLKYKVTSVPTFVILLNGKDVDRVEGVNVMELVRKLKALKVRVEMPPLAAAENRELMQRLQAITAQAPCVLFMEGSKNAPAKGDSSDAVALLQKAGLEFQHFDVTTDSVLRQQLIERLTNKGASNYPLLFVNGEFVGGIDKIKSLQCCSFLSMNGIPGHYFRLQQLISKAPIMVFMKGSPDSPRCGFSRTLVEMFKKHKVTFDSFDILTDEDVRQGLKQYSNWPTYPQVYVKGALIGGLDIIKELEESGELEAALNP